MKKCESCNLVFPDEKNFCKNCGTRLIHEYDIEQKDIAMKSVLEEQLKIDPLNVTILHKYADFLFEISLYKETIPILLKILAIDEFNDKAKDLLFKRIIYY
ncbi:MAG: hypothetical protein H6Q25_843 [Bacteroidetes bacterium]|nr:hypothetical protein [Bacteroidota bacterium]